MIHSLVSRVPTPGYYVTISRMLSSSCSGKIQPQISSLRLSVGEHDLRHTPSIATARAPSLVRSCVHELVEAQAKAPP